MLLIGDSGSSKTDWRLIDQAERITQKEGIGLNPYFVGAEQIHAELSHLFGEDERKAVSNVIVYVSGAERQERKAIVDAGLSAVFPQAKIAIEHDLLGAARAVCGNKAGLAGILGTGSNCCFYDGEIKLKHFPSGGFILGDEGGGVNMGKKLLKAFIENRMPDDLLPFFIKRYPENSDYFLQQLYQEPRPNRFLAKFARFAFHHKNHPFVQEIILDNFRAYFDKQVLRFPEAKEYPLGIVGSIAFYFQEELCAVAEEKGVLIGKILEKPIAGLTLYHLSTSE